MKKERDNSKRFEITGEIWWGFEKFENITVENDNKDKTKEQFILQTFPTEIENFSLFLNKCVPIIIVQIKDRKKNKNETWSYIEEDSKKIFLRELLIKFNSRNRFDVGLKKYGGIINSSKASLSQQGYQLVYSGQLQTKSRLIVGLGSSHVFETSLTLHHIYGIPYIPASALKGVCRMAAFWKIAGRRRILNSETQLKEVQEKFYGDLCSDGDILKYQLLFGAKNFKGLLLFLDAYPVINENDQIFDLDIINVHYQSYYSDDTGQTPPGDWENPVPIVFLTVKKGIKFEFNVLFDKFRAEEILKMDEKALQEVIPKDLLKNFKDLLSGLENNLKDEIKNLLEKALKNCGIGAKTRLSYGIFG